MSMEEKDYFIIRAEQELARAQTADHPEAARAHSLLAGFYFDRALNERRGPPSVSGKD